MEEREEYEADDGRD